MNDQANVVELFSKPRPTSNDEDFLVLLDTGDDYICYVRNYVASQECILVSNSILNQLPESLRPVTNVCFPINFSVLSRFEEAIRQFLFESNQMGHFSYLFNCSVRTFFESA